jgi:phage/plasmid primase-like uncharacterized protein/KaiC/GvpD/RAD55 family RecA-like ATPase
MMIDIQNIRDALSCIPPDLPRDEWAKMGMALKSELGDAGFGLFEAWSSRADGFKASDCKSTWQSIKAGGGVGIGTLFHLAKSHGYEPDTSTPPRPPNADEQRERAAQRKARDEAANAERERGHEAAALEAARMWASATDATESPYLRRKNVKGVRVRVASDGTLLIALRDVAGKLWNLQRIAPQRPTQGSDKLFLKGGRKSGLFHLIGGIEAPRALLVCEGAATGFSLHEATGLPVAIAFDSGNLFHVAKALRAAHLAAMIVVCGDDDGLQHGDTKNPGRDGAVKAATAIGARWVLPNREHLPEAGSDFNDAHVHAGLEAVKTTIENAIETPDETPQNSERFASENAQFAPQVYPNSAQIMEGSNVRPNAALRQKKPAPLPPRAVSLKALLEANLPEPVPLIDPIFCEADQMMIYGWRGSGKTWIALSLAYALASGGKFLQWQATRRCKVIFLDGEMRASRLKKRLSLIVAGSENEASDDALQIVTRDMQPLEVDWCDLAEESGREAMIHLIQSSGAEVAIIDNISAWARTGVEENNEASARGINDFVLSLRAKGIACVLIHHAGKGGQQRGTSKREDVLDTVIALKKPEEIDAPKGVDSELHFEKARNLDGNDQTPLRVRMVVEDDAAKFEVTPIESSQLKTIEEYAGAGASRHEICTALGIDRFQLKRALDKAATDGKVISIKDSRKEKSKKGARDDE